MHETGVHDRWGGPRAIFHGTLYIIVTHTNTVYKILFLVIVHHYCHNDVEDFDLFLEWRLRKYTIERPPACWI